jgi:hypothetical protein
MTWFGFVWFGNKRQLDRYCDFASLATVETTQVWSAIK